MKGIRRKLLRLSDYLYYADGYRKCEYVFPSADRKGYATIDSGYIPSKSAKYELYINTMTNQPVLATDAMSIVCGEAAYFIKETINGTTIFRVWDGDRPYHCIVGNRYLFNVTKNKQIVSGTEVDFSNTTSLHIFCGFAETILYHVAIIDNGELVRDFYPCYEEATGLYGLYDVVGNKFYTSANDYKINGKLLGGVNNVVTMYALTAERRAA